MVVALSFLTFCVLPSAPRGRSLSQTNRPASGITNWFILWTHWLLLLQWKITGKKKQKVVISNVFYISTKCLQKVNGDDTLQNFLPIHASTDQRPTEHLLLPERYLWQTFSGIVYFPQRFCVQVSFHPYCCYRKGVNVKGSKGEAMKICSPKSFICTAHCLWSLQFVICDCTGYLGISYLLQRHLKKARVMCEPALEARQAWEGKRERHYHVTVWKIFSVDPDFTEHLLAAH